MVINGPVDWVKRRPISPGICGVDIPGTSHIFNAGIGVNGATVLGSTRLQAGRLNINLKVDLNPLHSGNSGCDLSSTYSSVVHVSPEEEEAKIEAL